MKILKNVAGVIGGALIVILILVYPVMLLWNWLMPEIFGLMELGFFQTLGLLILSKAFFASGNNS